MPKRLVWVLILALLIVFAAALPVFAQGPQPGKLILGGNYTLSSGESLSGGLLVAGGNAVLQEGSRVSGDVLLAGGSLRVAGTVDGDVAVFGGDLQLLDTARINGDVVSFGGAIRQQPGAVVTGDVRQGGEFNLPGLRPVLPEIAPGLVTPEVTLSRSPSQWLLNQFLRLLQAIGLTLAFAALALVLAIVWPKGVERIGRTEMEQPLLAFAVGLLTWVLALGLAAVMVITICLIPFALLLALMMLVVVVLAWVTTGWVVGQKLLSLFKVRSPSFVLETVVGTVALLLTYFLVSLVFCLDFIFGVIVLCVGTGALVLTRFGRQPYAPGGRPIQPVTPPPPVALPEPQAVATQRVIPPSIVRSAEELGLPPEAGALAEDIRSDGEDTPSPDDRPRAS